MSVPLPNLDDRRWADLVEEGRALIPVYAPTWTDHNVHDPGITILELLAWLTETDIFRANRVPDRHRRKLLSLVGIRPEPPQAARAVLRFSTDGDKPLQLPADTEFTTHATPPTRFRTLDALTLIAGEIGAVQCFDSSGFRDLTRAWKSEEIFLPFGPAPQPGSEFYLGFTKPLPADSPVSLFFSFTGGRSGPDESERLREEAEARAADCRPVTDNPCRPSPPVDTGKDTEAGARAVRDHHAVRIAWDFLSAAPAGWVRLNPEQGQVEDQTRAFTLDGSVRLRLPDAPAQSRIGTVETAFYYVRARFDAGTYEAAPKIAELAVNATEVEQAVAAGLPLTIRPGADVTAPFPKPGELVSLRIRLDARNRIEFLRVEGTSDDPQFRVLAYRAPSGAAEGLLHLEAVCLGRGDGLPRQIFDLPLAPIQAPSLRLYSLESNDLWRAWEARFDLDASGPRDNHFVLDAQNGAATFGDGEHGRVPADGSLVFATYRVTRADSGNVGALAIDTPADSLHNRVLTGGWTDLVKALQSVANPRAAGGGSAEETVAHAEGRAIEMMGTPTRAVTLSDYERLAFETPGVQLARVTARANLHPGLPCIQAPGVITLIVLPELPPGRPSPSAALKRVVRSYLDRRRVIGTRLEVIGPGYREVAIRASVAAKPGVGSPALRTRIAGALDTFFDPLKGGHDGSGWPFGRNVYRAEILHIIDAVPGVDHVLTLELLSEACAPECGSVCLGPIDLVAAGQHEIEIVGQGAALGVMQ